MRNVASNPAISCGNNVELKIAVLMTLLAPGLWLQRLTTREPTLDQIEVSIRALQEVLRAEQAESDDELRAASRVEVMA